MWEKLKFISSQAWEFLYPFIKMLLSQIGPMIMQSAMAAVKTAAAETTMSNSAKRDLAFKMIAEDLPDIATSVINLAIEVAVTKFKNS